MRFSYRFPQRLTFLLLFLGLALAPRCDGGWANFENTGSLAQPRLQHTATLLPTGKALVAGGYDSNNFPFAVASAELYDPANGTWTPTGSLTNRRHHHTATLLGNGKVLVAGGAQFVFDLTSAELYDPATGTWTPTGSLNTSRRAHTATLLSDGRVLIAGGIKEDLGYGTYSIWSAEIYDPASGTWTTTGNLTRPRAGHTATLLPNGKVLVAGGASTSLGYFEPLVNAELYDPATGTWATTGSLTTIRGGHTATLLGNGKVLVAGGHNGFSNGFLNSAELYNPATGTWSPTGSFGAPRQYHTATLLPSGKVLVGGGSGPNGTVASADLYNPAGGEWSTVATMVTARESHTATLLHNGPLLLAGGLNGSQHLASAELYRRLTPSLLNISTRLPVHSGDNVLIGGFIIDGTEPKTLIVRGIGPSLPLPGALADPIIEVHGPSGELLGTNDNWKEAATSQQISDSGLAPSSDFESALWGVINPGAYTVILQGKDGESGVGSVEVYDLDPTSDSSLANISTRGFVDTDDNVMIAGLIVGGGTAGHAARVVVRALGSSISMNGTLANPTIELHNENGTSIAFNDDWKTRPDGSNQQPEIEATHVPPSNDLESALVQGLLPGSYTAIVRGKDDSTGIGLVEAYRLE